jgi:hypothetical protein
MSALKIIYAFIRWLIRRYYDRRVCIGDLWRISGIAAAVDLMIRATKFKLVVLWLNHKDTQNILDHFPEVNIPLAADAEAHLQVIPDDQRHDWTTRFIQYVSRIQMEETKARPLLSAFTVVIPFFAHLNYLKVCLDSVRNAARKAPEALLEVIIVNDDPRTTQEDLMALVPKDLSDRTRILQNRGNLGICASLNRGVQESRYPWILHLDCDDMLSLDCLKVLNGYIAQLPRVRYISSRMLDIDDQGRLLRVRLRDDSPSHLIRRGMTAGHLKAIRRDLFEAIGPYQNRYVGCQDYEFALRASLFEPILFIPDYLYQYRWHGNTQSVSKAQQQAQTTRRIIDSYLLAVRYLHTSKFPIPFSLQGPAAEEWRRACSEAGNNPDGFPVEIHKSFNEFNRRLFAVLTACHCVEYQGRMEQAAPLVF